MQIVTLTSDEKQYQVIENFIKSEYKYFNSVHALNITQVQQLVKDSLVGILIIDDSIDGFSTEMLSHFREENSTSSLYIIVANNANETDVITSYLKNGADSCTQKPFTHLGLSIQFSTAQKALSQSKLIEELNKVNQKLDNTQMRLVQSEKLASVGRLAAGIAHEINNPLGFVSGNIEALEKYIARYENVLEITYKLLNAQGDEWQSTLEQLRQTWEQKKIDVIREDMAALFTDTKDGVGRISVIVNGMKSFARINQQNENSVFDFNEGIRTTLIVARNELKYNCDVEFVEGKIDNIFVNGGQINQVVLNILINAAHAIKQAHPNEKGLTSIITYEQDGYVCCSISDNGCGMSEEIQSHIFEPFFTTKPIGVGSGLGLGLAYDTIHTKHGGEIVVNSTEGVGSEFIIKLPKAKNMQNGD